MEEIHVARSEPFIWPGTIVELILLHEVLSARCYSSLFDIQPTPRILETNGWAAVPVRGPYAPMRHSQ
jgi:hypothetical protein